VAVTAALRHYDEITLTDHLRNAVSSRSVIGQAIGIVIAAVAALAAKRSRPCGRVLTAATFPCALSRKTVSRSHRPHRFLAHDLIKNAGHGASSGSDLRLAG
jgi:hypothetical protein